MLKASSLKKLLIVFILSLLSGYLASQNEVDITFGDYDDEVINSIVRTSDNGFLMAGWTKSKSNGGKDIWLFKTDENFNIIWEKRHGTTKDDFANDICRFISDSYLVTGAKVTPQTDYIDVFILKITGTGELLWDKTYYGSIKDNSFSIIHNNDGGAMVSGYKEAKGDHVNELWTIKVDKKGKRLLQGVYGVKYSDTEGKSIIETQNGEIISVGKTNPRGDENVDIFMIKADSRGNEIWQKTYGDEFYDEANSVIEAHYNGFIIVGSITIKDYDSEDVYMAKIGQNGDIEWENSFGSSKVEKGKLAIKTEDNAYIILGTINAKGSENTDIWIIKTDIQGKTIWETVIEGEKSENINDIIAYKENQYLVAGSTNSKGKGQTDGWIFSFSDPPENQISAFDVASRGNINDKKPPVINITYPATTSDYKTIIDQKMIKVTGKAEDESGIKQILVNGKEATFRITGEFEAYIVLPAGSNIITVKATDLNDNSAIRETDILRGESIVKDKETVSSFAIDTKVNKYYALLIGINDYLDPEINDLSNPIHDAEMLKNTLTQYYTFEDENITFLKNPSRADIIVALDELSDRITQDDNLVVFYAGHGYWDENKELGYWLPADARKANTAYWLRNSTIRDYIFSIKSKHTLLIADACFSGGIFKTRSAFSDASKAINKLYELNSRKGMTSGTLKEVPDRSVFIEYLNKRLIQNDNRYISSEMLFSSFREAVLNNSPNVPQFGTIQNAGDEGGDFIFIKK